MMLRDGRGVLHDLGPRRALLISMLPYIGSTETSGTGGWDRRLHTGPVERPETPAPAPVTRVSAPRAKSPRRPQTRAVRTQSKQEYDRQYAAARRAARDEAQRIADRAYHRAYMQVRRAALG